MSLTKRISEIWESQSEYNKPDIIYGKYFGLYYLTVKDDEDGIIRFVDTDTVYLTPRKRTKKGDVNGDIIYEIEDGFLYRISCEKALSNIDQFVFDNILPIFKEES